MTATLIGAYDGPKAVLRYTDSDDYLRLTMTTDDGEFTPIDTVLTVAEVEALYKALHTHALLHPPFGSEFATPRPTREDMEAPRQGDEFPNVGYVRYMKDGK